MIKILLADDHPVVRDGIKSLINEIEGVSVVAVAKNGEEALKCIGSQNIDIALLDIDMPIMNGIQTLSVLRRNHPLVKVIFLSMYSKHSNVKQAYELKVDGYVLKSDSKEEMEFAIKEVAAGNTHMSREVELVALEIFKSPNMVTVVDLTNRELDVLKLICEDMMTEQIAEVLGLSKFTVNIYRTKLIEKTGYKTPAGLALFAKANNII